MSQWRRIRTDAAILRANEHCCDSGTSPWLGAHNRPEEALGSEESLRHHDDVVGQNSCVQREFERVFFPVDDAKNFRLLGCFLGEPPGHGNGHMDRQAAFVAVPAWPVYFPVHVDALSSRDQDEIVGENRGCCRSIENLHAAAVSMSLKPDVGLACPLGQSSCHADGLLNRQALFIGIPAGAFDLSADIEIAVPRNRDRHARLFQVPGAQPCGQIRLYGFRGLPRDVDQPQQRIIDLSIPAYLALDGEIILTVDLDADDIILADPIRFRPEKRRPCL